MSLPFQIAEISMVRLDRELSSGERTTLTEWVEESDANRQSFEEWHRFEIELRQACDPTDLAAAADELNRRFSPVNLKEQATASAPTLIDCRDRVGAFRKPSTANRRDNAEESLKIAILFAKSRKRCERLSEAESTAIFAPPGAAAER